MVMHGNFIGSYKSGLQVLNCKYIWWDIPDWHKYFPNVVTVSYTNASNVRGLCCGCRRHQDVLAPQAFWQSKEHEIDFYDEHEKFIEIKRGKCTALEFSWFVRQLGQHNLTVINKNKFTTDRINGLTLHDF